MSELENIVNEISVEVTAVLGKKTLSINQILKLRKGAVVELNKKVGEQVEIYLRDRMIARGEITIKDNIIGITLTEVVEKAHHRGQEG